MKLLVSLYPFARWDSAESMTRAVRRMDELGIYGLSIPEHIVVPDNETTASIGGTWPETIVLGSYFAGVTERLRFAYYALVVPYRNPVVLAKQIATFDYMSGGRTEFVFATGWYQEEFDAIGVPFDRRGERTDDAIAAMKELWTSEGPATHHGPFVNFDNVIFEPKPAQKPHPPILIGGSGERPIRRVLEHGDGWAPMLGDAASIAPDIARVKAEAAAEGRDPEELAFMFNLQIGAGDPAVRDAFSHSGSDDEHGEEQAGTQGGSPEQVITAIREYSDAGVTHIMTIFDWETPEDYIKQLEWLAAEIVPHV